MLNYLRLRIIPFVFLTFLLGGATLSCGTKGQAPTPTAGEAGKVVARDTAEAPAGIRFSDVGPASGLRFRWSLTPRRPLRVLDTFGCGSAFLDYDADGWLDILLVGEPKCGLFRNERDGRFTDVSGTLGLDRFTGPWKGCAVGDPDGDGYPDILLTGYRRLLLVGNLDGKGWEDRTAQVGLEPDNRDNWGSSAGFMDLDGDNDQDLVVLNYVVFNERTPQLCELAPGVMSGCPPQTYRPEFGRLYRNEEGIFRDVTQASGFGNASGKGLVVGFCDYDDDGRIDFYVGNDGTPAELMRNLGGFRFRNVGVETGAAYGVIPGQAIASMGVDWADYNRDGFFDFAVSAFENEAYGVFANDGSGFFRTVSDQLGVTTTTFKPLGFGTNFLDVDNDRYPDLFYANGHVYDNADQIYSDSSFPQRMLLFHNEGGERFTDLAPRLGADWERKIVGRGSARGDFDNDGRIDLLVVDYQGAPLLLRNESDTGNHWLSIAARGVGKNRLGYGLRVTAQSGAERWVGEISPAASYLSTSAPRVHFGLGSTRSLETLTLRWPDGKISVLRDVPADQLLTVRHPDLPSAPAPLSPP